MDSQNAHPPQPPTTPSLPRLYVDEKIRGFKSWAAIISLSIVVLLVPIGVYLVGQRTNLLPKAANLTSSGPSLVLETPSDRVSDGSQFPVEVKFKPSAENINLIAAKIKYPPQNLEVVKIERGSGLPFSEWIKEDFNNITGKLEILAAAPNPGVQLSDENSQILATITFRAKGSALAQINLEPGSGIYKNSDNQNLVSLENLGFLNLNINYSASSTPPPPQIAASSAAFSTSSANLIEVPNGGEVFSYYKSIPINWDRTKLTAVKLLSLYINDTFFAELGRDIENTGRVLWQPQTTLILAYINPKNSYKIGIEGLDKNGQNIKDLSEGPFGITAKADFESITATPSAAAFEITAGNIFETVSRLLSNYGLEKIKNPEMDLNGDGLVNSVDLWLLEQKAKDAKVLID